MPISSMAPVHSVISTGGFLSGAYTSLSGVALRPSSDIYVSIVYSSEKIARINPTTGDQTNLFLTPFIAKSPSGIGLYTCKTTVREVTRLCWQERQR